MVVVPELIVRATGSSPAECAPRRSISLRPAEALRLDLFTAGLGYGVLPDVLPHSLVRIGSPGRHDRRRVVGRERYVVRKASNRSSHGIPADALGDNPVRPGGGALGGAWEGLGPAGEAHSPARPRSSGRAADPDGPESAQPVAAGTYPPGESLDRGRPGGRPELRDFRYRRMDAARCSRWISLHFRAASLLRSGSLYGILQTRVDGSRRYLSGGFVTPFPGTTSPTSESAGRKVSAPWRSVIRSAPAVWPLLGDGTHAPRTLTRAAPGRRGHDRRDARDRDADDSLARGQHRTGR